MGLNPLSAGRSFQTRGATVPGHRWFSLNPLSAGRSFQTLAEISDVSDTLKS